MVSVLWCLTLNKVHMVAPTRVNYKVYQGSTFGEDLRWESDTKVYKTITAISKSAPLTVTAVGHGMPEGWRFKLTNILGTVELNSDTNYHIATTVATDLLTVNAVNSLAYTTYISGGVVEYNEPVDLAGMTGRMQIRSSVESTAVIYEATTANGGVVLNNTTKIITLTIPATTTALFAFSSAMYSLELINGTEVIPLLSGNLTLVKEVTR